MRISTLVALMLIVTALFMLGCDGTSGYYNIDGDYTLGTVQFVYGGNQTWTLYDVIVTVDTTEGRVYFSGIDSQNLLWGYSGDYDRTDDRIVALDMPEVDYGSEDQLDLRLEFTSNSRFEGVAINWVYENGDLQDVGAANISGRETFIAAAQARDVKATGDTQKIRTFDSVE